MTFSRSLWAHACMMVLSGATMAVSGCGPEEKPEPQCLSTPADGDCSPALYGLRNGVISPTFDEVFTNTLKPICAETGCHSGPNPAGGLRLDEIEVAHVALLQKNTQGQDRVIPGDLACGKVIVRLETSGESWSMPPGSPLSEPTLCAIRHWIAQGALR